MNIEQATVEVRQRSLLEVTDLSFRYVFALGGKLYFKLWLVYCAPPALLLWAAARWLDFSWVTVWILALLLGNGLQGLFTVAAGRLMFQREVSFGAVTRQYFSRFWSYLGALVFTRALLGLSALLFIALPFMWVRYAHVHEAVLLEGASAGESMKRAARFVDHHGGTTFALGLVLCSVTVGVVAACELAGQAIVRDVFQLGTPVGELTGGGSLFMLLGYFAALAFCATLRFLAYIDARTRRDGWDVQVRFMAIRARAEAAL